MHRDRQQAGGATLLQSSSQNKVYGKSAWASDTPQEFKECAEGVARGNTRNSSSDSSNPRGVGDDPEQQATELPSNQEAPAPAPAKATGLPARSSTLASTSTYGKVELPCEMSWTFFFKVLFMLAFLIGEKAVCLSAQSWLALAFGQAPFNALRGLSLGFMYTMFVEHESFKRQVASNLFFILLWTLGPLLSVSLGRKYLSAASLGGAIVLWSVVVVPYTKRKLPGFLAVLWGVCTNVTLVVCLRNFLFIQGLLPRDLRGLTMPTIVTIYDMLGSITVAQLFRRFGADAVSSNIFFYVSGQVIMTAEALRAVGFLATLRSDDWLKEMFINVASSCFFDLIARTSAAHSMFYCVCQRCGWSKRTSPERDLQMRARFSLSYVPIIVLVVQLPLVSAMTDISYFRNWKFWTVLVSILLNEVLSDLCCLACLRVKGESLLDTFRSLQRPGGHRVLQFSSLSIVPVEDVDENLAAPMDNVLAIQEELEDTGCTASIYKCVGWWHIFTFAAVMVDSSMDAVRDQCGWNLTDKLCMRLAQLQ